MAIYIFLLIGVVVAGIPLCSEKCGRSGRMIYCCAAAVVFIFISAIRFGIGSDYHLYGFTYYNMQYVFPEDLTTEKMEKGFLLPLYILNLAFESYTAVFVFTSIIIYPVVFYLIYKNSSSPWISAAAYLCMGLFFNSICFIRQVIASLIILYAMKYMDQKFPVRFFILTFAASVFHWTALIMLAMFFLLKIKPGHIYLGVIAAGTIIFCIFSKTFMTWAVDHFAMYSIYDPETMPEAVYGLSPKFTIAFGALFILFFVFRKRLIEKDPRNSIYINCMMYTVVFEAMGMRHAVLSRFDILIFLPPVLYTVPDLVQVIREFISERLTQRGEGRVRMVNICALSCLSLYFAGTYLMLMLGDYNGVVPYVSHIDLEEKYTYDNYKWYDDNYEWFEHDDEWYDNNDEWDNDDEWFDEDYEWYDEEEWVDSDEQPGDSEELYIDEEQYIDEDLDEGEPLDEETLEQMLLDQILKIS